MPCQEIINSILVYPTEMAKSLDLQKFRFFPHTTKKDWHECLHTHTYVILNIYIFSNILIDLTDVCGEKFN